MKKGWNIARFGDFLTINLRPYTLRADQDANLVGMRWYGEGPFHRENKPAIKILKKSHFIINTGDIIYNKLFAWKGSFGIVKPELDGMFVSDKFPTYKLNRNVVDENYLRWYFCYPPLWDQARKMSTGSAALSKLTLNPPKFLELTITFPLLIEEQKRIAYKIEDLNNKIKEAQLLRIQAVEEAEALVKSVSSRLFKDIRIDGTLADVLIEKPRNGWSPKCDNDVKGTPVLSLSAVTGFHYNRLGYKMTSERTDSSAHYWLQPNDLLITRSNTPELVGHVAIYDGDPYPCIYPDLIMKLKMKQNTSLRFVWMWLQTNLVRDYIFKNAKGTSPTMKKISQGVVMNIPFPTSLSYETQCQLVSYLEIFYKKVEFFKKQQLEMGNNLDLMMSSVLETAFKGEL